MSMSKNRYKRACSSKKFATDVVIHVLVVAFSVLDESCSKAGLEITAEQREWFACFADWRVRWFYANDTQWRGELLKDDPRDWLEARISHWADAFLKEGPDNFIRRKQSDSEILALVDAEWKPKGSLGKYGA